MNPGRLDILTEALTFVARLIMQARSDRDAEALRNQLRALGETKRSDVDAVERERRLELAGFEPVDPDELGTLRRLRQDEPTQSGPLEKRTPIAPDFPHVCGSCKRPLDGGD